MQGNKKVIHHLNQLLLNELTAINQYFLHARMLQSWGYAALAKHEYDESLDEMRHADQLTQRILMLEGLPNLQKLGTLRIGENVPEILNCDLGMEVEGLDHLRAAISSCEQAQDYVSRELCQSILASEEKHTDWLETQLNLIEKLGEASYLQLQIGSGEG